MTQSISRKIVSFHVVDVKAQAAKEARDREIREEVLRQLKEEAERPVERPEVLDGRTYKVKVPTLDSSLYVTINDYVTDRGTPNEKRRPFEMFINSKNIEHFQWVVALTRVVSAVFRKGGEVGFLVEQLGSVFDPNGGYFMKGGKFMPSLVAHIGTIIDKHLIDTGVKQAHRLDEAQANMLKEKREQLMGEAKSNDDESNSYPESAVVCTACHTKAVVMQGGCDTCLACGKSKCA